MGNASDPTSLAAVEEETDGDSKHSFAVGVLAFVLIGLGGCITLSVSVAALPWLSTLGFGMQTTGTALLVYGLALYARNKGRMVLLGGLGLLTWIGVLVLALMNKTCRRCGANTGRSSTACDACGAAV